MLVCMDNKLGRDMWCKRTHTLNPLTKLFPTKVKFKFTYVEENALMGTNKIVSRDVLIL